MLAKAFEHRWVGLATLLVVGALAVGLIFGIGLNHQVSAQQPPCDTTKAGGDCLGVVKGAQSQIGQPVPSNVIVSASGLEWVWASPCALNGCTSGIDVGHDGFKFATPAQWALFPFNSFTGGSGNTGTPCASPWFDLTHNHCDRINLVDPSNQHYGSAPSGGTPAVNNGVPGVMAFFAETFLVRTAGVDLTPVLNAIGRLETKADRLEPKADNINQGVGRLEGKADRLEAKIDQGVMPGISRLEGKADRLEAKIDQGVMPGIGRLEGKADRLESKLDAHEAVTIAITTKFLALVARLESKLDRVETKLDKLEAKAEKLQNTLDELSKFVKCLPSSRSVVPPQERLALGCPPG